MNSHPRIIIPGGTERIQTTDNIQIAPENEKPKFNLPKEVKDEVRKFVPEAREVADKIHELLGKGYAAQVALVCQESVRVFLGEHMRSLLPQMINTFAHIDRMQIHNIFRQISEQRLSTANISAEGLDKKTYELAFRDFMSIINKVPPQVLPIEVGLPDLDLESPESEAPPQDTTSGET
jgi:hypothetical protein